MSDGATHKRDLTRAGEAEVRDILPAPVQESLVLFPKNSGSDSIPRHPMAPFAGLKCDKYCATILRAIATSTAEIAISSCKSRRVGSDLHSFERRQRGLLHEFRREMLSRRRNQRAVARPLRDIIAR